MSRYSTTTNYNLRKPGPLVADKADTLQLWGVDINLSLDLIDTRMKTNADGVATNVTNIGNKLDATGDDLVANTVTFTDDDKGTGTTLSLDLDDSNMFHFEKTSGTTIAVALSNGGDGSYLLRMKNTVGSAVTVTFTGGTIQYADGVANFILGSAKTGIFTIIQDGTSRWIAYTEFDN